MPVRRAALMLLLAATSAAASAAAPATRPATRPLAPGASGLAADATPAGAADYVKSAEAYVEANPAAPDAGAALMDALTVATAAGDSTATFRLQRRILWDYPDSVAAAYLLTSNDFKALQPVFESFLPDDWYDAPPGLTRGLAAALRRPMARYGADLFADDAIALKVGLLFREAGDAATVRAALQRFETQRTNTAARAVALAVLDPNVAPTPADALAALEAFGDRRAVAPFELYFLRLLPKAARATPAMRRREALAGLAAASPERALAAFDRLADGGAIDGGADLGRLQFLHAWAAARTGQYDRAADLMAAAKASGGPWGEAAARLAPTLPGATAALAEQRAAVAAQLAADPAKWMVQGRVRATGTRGGKPLEAYAGFASAGRLKLDVRSAGATSFAYRTTGGGAADLYLSGDATGSHYAAGAVFPMPTLDLQARPGGLEIKLGLGVTQDAAKAAAGLAAGFKVDPGVLDALMEKIVAAGVPAPAERAADGSVTYHWLVPPAADAAEPAVSDVAVRIGPGGAISSAFDFAGWRVAVAFGPDGSFELAPPAWPDVPSVDRPALDQRIVAPVLQKLSALFAGK